MFKAGDKVRILKTDYPHHFKIGDIVTVINPTKNGFHVKWDLNGSGAYFFNTEVELVEEYIPVKKSKIKGWGF